MTPQRWRQQEAAADELSKSIREAVFKLITYHEVAHHDGEECVANRAGLVAWLAHCIGLGLADVPMVVDILALYAEHHDDEEEGETTP